MALVQRVLRQGTLK